MWRGETAFVLASGPSLTRAICDRLLGRHVIAVNSSCMLAPHAEVLYFTDSSWYEQRRDLVANWPRLVVSMSKTAKRELPDKVRRVKGSGDPSFPPRFPPPGSATIQQGRSSGHTAVSLAIAFRPALVVLLGFDMRLVNGREHHHAEYSGVRDLDQYRRDFVPAFNGWNTAAIDVGVRVVNATPGSALTEFPMVSLDEMMEPRAHAGI